MPIKLKKHLFARNRIREEDLSNFFNKTSSGITNALPLIITVFFTPAVITTSLLSKEIIVILANLSLSLGYISNFSYRLYHHEVSKSELLISAIALGALLTISYFLFPPLVALSFINFLSFLNQMAVIINLFFLTKHVVVPPAKRLVEKIAHHMGFNIEGLYFSKPPLTLEDDRFVIDQLLIKTYGHDSFSSHFKLSDLKSFNKLLTVLSHYINKYDESFFGYLKNNDDITALEQQITDLTTTGNPDSSYTFIRKKIGYKTTKIQLLKTAEALVNKTLADETKPNIKPALHFFSGAEKHTQNINETLSTGILCIQKEIKRQEDKIDLLKECLPFVII